MDFKPYPYQAYCIKRCVEDKQLGLFLDMGLGKTVITLSAVKELRYNRLAVSKVLVIAPKSVAEATWTAERDRWAHLSGLRIELVLGTAKARIEALNRPSDIWVINRENVRWLVQHYQQLWPFDMVIVDELSSFKNHNAQRFKALKAIRPKIKRLIGLTGTPAPNGYLDLWSQIFLLDEGERLYTTVGAYRARFFDHNPYRYSYELKQGAGAEIDKRLKDLCVSMSAEDYLQLPDLIVDDVPVHLDHKAQSDYERFERDNLLAWLEGEGEESTLTANSAAVLTNKLLQFCGGAVYDEARQVVRVHDCKLEAMAELVERLEGKSLLVFYSYQHERERLLELFSTKFKGLKVRELKTAKDQEAWNAGRVDILLAHPASTAYGLNLQQGGNHVVWYSLSWSLELYQQANKRLHRQGQSEKVIVHRLIVQGGQDEEVAKALEDKGNTQALLLENLKAKVEKLKAETVKKLSK